MNYYTNKKPSDFYKLIKGEYLILLENEMLPKWVEDYCAPSDFNSYFLDTSTRVVEEGFGSLPIFRPAEPVDNSASKIAFVFGIVSLITGIVSVSFIGPLGVLVSLTSIFWFVMSRGVLNKQEDADERARREYNRDVQHFYASRDKCIHYVVLLMQNEFHRAIRRQEHVPERLEEGFVELSKLHFDDLRYEWVDEIEEWASQPEYPARPDVSEEKVGHQEYEEYCCQVLASWGYLDAKTTRFSRDGGIDIETSEFVVQCKHYSGFLGVREVREIFGLAAHYQKTAVVFCSGSYTSDAKKFAQEAGVALFVLDETKSRIQYVNQHAESIAARRASK